MRDELADSPHPADVEGLHLGELATGDELEVRTRNRSYRIVILHGREALISGHPVFCERPTLVRLQGSTWGGSMIWADFIGTGMYLEFWLPDGRAVTTSPVTSIRRVSPAQSGPIGRAAVIH